MAGHSDGRGRARLDPLPTRIHLPATLLDDVAGVITHPATQMSQRLISQLTARPRRLGQVRPPLIGNRLGALHCLRHRRHDHLVSALRLGGRSCNRGLDKLNQLGRRPASPTRKFIENGLIAFMADPNQDRDG